MQQEDKEDFTGYTSILKIETYASSILIQSFWFRHVSACTAAHQTQILRHVLHKSRKFSGEDVVDAGLVEAVRPWPQSAWQCAHYAYSVLCCLHRKKVIAILYGNVNFNIGSLKLCAWIGLSRKIVCMNQYWI